MENKVDSHLHSKVHVFNCTLSRSNQSLNMKYCISVIIRVRACIVQRVKA